MDDSEIHSEIEKLVAEEHELWDREAPGDQERLEKVRIALDQCWDLLRQRRAYREFGMDPEAARLRPSDVVEHYEQ
ncbi:MAG TPA: DUF2630 family protein [Gaiellaceae bacterium]|nr:DUF2630 family protein [Gaiellaceae bacterium]